MDTPEHRVHTRWDQPRRLRFHACKRTKRQQRLKCALSLLEPGEEFGSELAEVPRVSCCRFHQGIHEWTIVQDTIQMCENFAVF